MATSVATGRICDLQGTQTLSDWFQKSNAAKACGRRLGVFDSWLNSSLAGSWQSLQDRWNAASSFFARFRLSGWKRLLNEGARKA